MTFKVMVIGGHDAAQRNEVSSALTLLHQRKPVTRLIHSGAATAAHMWAFHAGVDVDVYLAGAGINVCAGETPAQRSERMFKYSGANYVVAFPGDSGTAYELTLAEKAKLPVWHPVTI